jgi:hypothetical protein
VKTRTLLLLAVGCGLVILVAGGIKLFLIAAEEPPRHLVAGETGTAGDMEVTMVGAMSTGTDLYVTVRLVGADDPDGAVPFELRTGSERLTPRDVPAPIGQSCAATSATQPVTCVLGFPTDATAGLLLYERTSDDVLRFDVTVGTTG